MTTSVAEYARVIGACLDIGEPAAAQRVLVGMAQSYPEEATQLLMAARRLGAPL